MEPLLYPFGGLGLARRLESAVAANLAAIAAPESRLHIAGGSAAFAGPVSPLSYAVGLGLSGPVQESDLETMERFFLDRGAPPTIDLCPLADPTLNELLGKRGYRIAEFNNVLVRPLDPSYLYRNDAVTQSADPAEWARTVSQGFVERENLTQEELDLAHRIYNMPDATAWLARSENEPAAAASLAIRDRLAMLLGGSTIPRFRKRGLHAALIQTRLAYAASQNCDLATASTAPGSQSQLNYQRLGFRLVYMKLTMTLDQV